MPVAACGLANVGETCYLNTLLQCLRACDEFRNLILKSNDSNKCPIANALRELFELMEKHAGIGVVSPRGFVHEVSKAFTFLDVRSQNDVHEMFMLLVAKLAEELHVFYKDNNAYANLIVPKKSRFTKVTISPLIKAAFKKLGRKCDDAWTQAFAKECSPLTDLIHGQLLAQIICGHCKYIHHNYQPFSVWEIQVIDKGVGQRPTLEECFLASLESESLHDWKCSKCMTTTVSQKIIKIWRLPQVLVICLKRFKQGPRGNLIKINTEVDIPLDVQLFPMANGPHDTGVHYTLRASAIHMGDIQFGHYHALANTPSSWTVINDGSVCALGNNNDLKDGVKDGYMLFYEVGNILS